jgi:hypothetical protein
MKRRARRFSEYPIMSVITVKSPLRKRTADTTVNGEEEAAEVTRPSQPIRPGAEDKLAALRRLDKSRAWNSLDDQLYCTICKTVISGRRIEVVGGTNGLRALHLKCSTPGCFSTPADWILPVKSDTVREIDILFRDNGA